MTKDDKDVCIAKVTREYSSIREKIVLLQECLKRKGWYLENLGRRLQTNPLGVEFGEYIGSNFTIKHYGADDPKEIPVVDLEDIRQKLHDLRSSKEEKKRIEETMMELKLGNLIVVDK